jgi:hypothetical protein
LQRADGPGAHRHRHRQRLRWGHINFSCSGNIPISSTLTISTDHLTLDGSGQSVTLDGGHSMQVLSVGGVTFAIDALTIADGSRCSGDGGGMVNHGTVSITNSTFSGNSACSDVGVGGAGGALWNDNFGTVSISNSTFI